MSRMGEDYLSDIHHYCSAALAGGVAGVTSDADIPHATQPFLLLFAGKIWGARGRAAIMKRVSGVLMRPIYFSFLRGRTSSCPLASTPLLSLPRVEIPFSQLKTNGCDAREQQELGTPKQVQIPAS